MQEPVLPFYLKWPQPLRGIFAFAVTAVIAVVLYFVLLEGPFWPKAYPADLVAPLYLLCMFIWLFLFRVHFLHWPFHKLQQPLKGACVSVLVLAMGALTYYMFFYVAGWGAYINQIVSIWLLTIFIFGPFGNFPILYAFMGKQPLTGIVTSCVTLGLALLIWYIVPHEFLSMHTGGIPFAWFLGALTISSVYQHWPIRVKAPLFVPLIIGMITFITFSLIWAFKAAGYDLMGTYYPANLNPNEGNTIFTLILLMWLIPVFMFQFWPIHKVPNIMRGTIVVVFMTLAAIGVYWGLITLFGQSGPTVSKMLFAGFCAFVGLFFYQSNFGADAAPPVPGAVDLHIEGH